MTRYVVPSDVSRELTALHQCVAICDDEGKTIGFFTPITEAPRGPHVSDEELDRRERDDPVYSTAEVLAHLETL